MGYNALSLDTIALGGTDSGDFSLGSGSCAAAGSEAGVFVSTDGCGNWTALNNGLPGS